MEFLQRQRLRFVARNVLCRGGEIDLVMRDRDGALVFVEVRARAQQQLWRRGSEHRLAKEAADRACRAALSGNPQQAFA